MTALGRQEGGEAAGVTHRPLTPSGLWNEEAVRSHEDEWGISIARSRRLARRGWAELVTGAALRR